MSLRVLRLSLYLAALTTTSSAFAQSAPARGEKPAMTPVEIARGHFRLAIDSHKDGDLDTALIEFKRAYEASPNFRLLYNLGQVSQELRDYPSAERYYSQYLKEGESQLDAQRKQEVEYELAKVRVRIASVRVTSNVRGAEVFIDDVSVGKTPFAEPVRVSTGQRRVTARAPGFVPFTQMVDVAGGEVIELPLDLTAAVSGEAKDTSYAEREPSRNDSETHIRPLSLGLLIGTGALAVGAGISAYLASSQAAEYREALTRKTSKSELHELSDSAKTKALVCDVLLGATAVAAAASVVVIWKLGLNEREDVQVSAGPGSVHLRGRF